MKQENKNAESRKVQSRNRWVGVCNAAVLLWCVWWYSRGGDQGLLLATAVMGLVAVIIPRSFPGNTRWVIWTWLLVTVVCLSANVVRIIPPEKTGDTAYFVHRVVTIIYAMSATCLFFRPGKLVATFVMIGVIPLIMQTLWRGAGLNVAITSALDESLVIWGYVVIVSAGDLVRQVTEKKATGSRRMARWDLLGRLAMVLLVIAVSFAFFKPTRWVVREAQRQLFGWSSRLGLDFMSQRGTDLFLGRPLPKGFRNLTRIVMLVQSDHAPGYLRENVYTTYLGGRWARIDPGEKLASLETTSVEGEGMHTYSLAESVTAENVQVMQIEVFAPKLMTSFCVPGNARTLTCTGNPPQQEANGMLTSESAYPDRYWADVAPRRWLETAYPLPKGFGKAEYLKLPTALSGTISNWVASCNGLTVAPTAREAASCIEEYFTRDFKYRLDVRMRSEPDPLLDFMAQREGFCIHFASASALMLRAQGIPTRVVGGFVCSERSALLKRWIVRERQGHAWVEAWDDVEGQWFIVESTPAGGLPDSIDPPDRLRRIMDVVVSLWKRLVFYLGQVNLLVAIADAGAVAIFYIWNILWGPAGIALVLVLGLFLWRRGRKLRHQRNEEAVLRAALTTAMKRLARRAVPERLMRGEAESWDTWVARIEPNLAPEAYAALRESVEHYQRLRYQRYLDKAAAAAWLESSRKTVDFGSLPKTLKP